METNLNFNTIPWLIHSFGNENKPAGGKKFFFHHLNSMSINLLLFA